MHQCDSVYVKGMLLGIKISDKLIDMFSLELKLIFIGRDFSSVIRPSGKYE